MFAALILDTLQVIFLWQDAFPHRMMLIASYRSTFLQLLPPILTADFPVSVSLAAYLSS